MSEDRTPDILSQLTGGTPAEKKQPSKTIKQQDDKSLKRENEKGLERQGVKSLKRQSDKAIKRYGNTVQQLHEYTDGDKEKATIYFFTDTIDRLDMAQAKSKRTVSQNGSKRGQVTRSLITEFAVRAYLDDFEQNGQDSKLANLLSAI